MESSDQRLTTTDEEAELVASMIAGDLDARNHLVLVCQGLVVTIAGDFQGRGLDLDDLVQEGNLGLIHATKKFDPRFGTPFGTYARRWIKAAMRTALAEQVPLISIPYWAYKELRRRSSEASRGAPELIEQARHVAGMHRSGLDPTLLAGTSQEPSAQPEHDAIARERARVVRRVLDDLDPVNAQIARWRYGLDGEGPLNLNQIARKRGISPQAVRKRLLRFEPKLRAALERLDEDSPRSVLRVTSEPGSEILPCVITPPRTETEPGS